MPPPLVEVRVAASPTAEFALMLRVLHLSLMRNGGLADPRLTAMIGARAEEMPAAQSLAAWLAPRVRCVIVDPADYERDGVFSAGLRRLTEPTDAEVVVLVDPDVVICGQIADACADVVADPAVVGVIAPTPPLRTPDDWRRLYAAAGLGPPDFPYRYTGWPYLWPRGMRRRPDAPLAPPYFNFGFIAMTRAQLRTVGGDLGTCAAIAAAHPPRRTSAPLHGRRRSSIFRWQVALTLAIERAGLPHRALGMRYNFPNDYRLEALHPIELADARVIHLWRRDQGFSKRQIFRSLAAVREFAAAGWRTAGAIEQARRVVENVLGEVEPPPPELGRTRWQW